MSKEASNKENTQHPIIMFDGDCNLCNGFIDFIIPEMRRISLPHFNLYGQEKARIVRTITAMRDLIDGQMLYQISYSFHIIRRLFSLEFAHLMVFPGYARYSILLL
jgi:predicted DCC family thiol-disulfide oxidoreductase YuxK